MAELADAYGSGPYECKFMQVQVLLPAPNQSTNFDTKTAFHLGGLFLRLCPEPLYSCGFRAFSVLGTVGAAALKSRPLHGRPLEIFKSIRLCTTLKTIRIQAGASLKTVPGLYTF